MKIAILSADRTGPDGAASNIGDALLTDALAHAMQARGIETMIIDFGEIRTTDDLPRRRVNGFTELVYRFRDVDAVVVGGGTLLQDDAGSGFGGLPRLCLAASVAARIARRPLVFLGVGCDPIHRALPRWALRLATMGRSVWVRDEESFSRFAQYFRRRPELGADVSLLGMVHFSTWRNEAGGGTIVALNRRDSHQLTAQNRRKLSHGGGGISFISMDQRTVGGDEELLPPDLESDIRVVRRGRSWREVVGELAAADVIVASRMHALYIGMMLGKRLVAVGDSTKVTTFASEFAVPQIHSLDDYQHGMEQSVSDVHLGSASIRAVDSLDAALRALRRSMSQGARRSSDAGSSRMRV